MTAIRHVYVAGPLTCGDLMGNVRRAIEAADILRRRGYAPFCPHLNVLAEVVCPAPYEAWMDLDFAWLEKCDALVRLPGESPGADREVTFAEEHGIPVFRGVHSFLARERS